MVLRLELPWLLETLLSNRPAYTAKERVYLGEGGGAQMTGVSEGKGEIKDRVSFSQSD